MKRCPDPTENPDYCAQCEGYGVRCTAWILSHPEACSSSLRDEATLALEDDPAPPTVLVRFRLIAAIDAASEDEAQAKLDAYRECAAQAGHTEVCIFRDPEHWPARLSPPGV